MESQMTCSVSEMWSPKMPQGLELEYAHHPLTMKRVVNLIIAMERLKAGRSEPVLSTEFRDEHLLSIMLESIVEEQIVYDCHSVPTDEFNWIEDAECTMTDSQKRSLIRHDNGMELWAVMLQGGSEGRKVHLNMSTYTDPTPSNQAIPVALRIKDTDLYLSCHKSGDEPTLHLEAVKDKDSLSHFSTDSELVRFLFYRRDTGLTFSTLMSARYPSRYISTAQDDSKPVEMCTESASRYRTFTIQHLTQA
ncbi:interleukin-1 beta-like [Lates japonicus]